MDLAERKTGELHSLYKIAFALAVFTIVYNIAEGAISVLLGYADESMALLGFGTDSFVEVISGLGIVHMIQRVRQNSENSRDTFEKQALRTTGVSFFILAAGLSISAFYNLITRHKPETTIRGVVISLISIIIMVLLIAGKTRTGKKLDSDAILADAECTKVCVYMSVILLLSSTVNELTGFIYTDSLGTLGLAYLSFKEGKECLFKAKNNVNCGCHKL
jgi:divalent metal cation (Fe/Co/Zn/Cd) transporter